MTTDRILEIVAKRGLSVEVVNGQPRLRGDREKATKRLLEALRWHRQEIIDRLRPKQTESVAADLTRPIEVRWSTGAVGRHFFPEQGWPIGAREWRYVDQSNDWSPIPEAERPTRPAGGWTGGWPGQYVGGNDRSRYQERKAELSPEPFFGRSAGEYDGSGDEAVDPGSGDSEPTED